MELQFKLKEMIYRWKTPDTSLISHLNYVLKRNSQLNKSPKENFLSLSVPLI